MARGRIEVVEQAVDIVEDGPSVEVTVVEQNVLISEAVVGLPGSGGDRHFIHEQSTPSATWRITHNLGKNPAVTIVDSSGNEWQTAVEHVSANECIVRF
jgi:hypothetical protein